MSLDSNDMVKRRRVHSTSSDELNKGISRLQTHIGSTENMKEWDKARCPICIEHPHNVVLLKCSSHEKGCRPFMCNTSYRHSNWFDQFYKSSVLDFLAALLPEIPPTFLRTNEEQIMTGQTSNLQLKLSCPFCRGEIFGYIVIQPAHQHMNKKVRSCSTEACSFSGTYSELRKHARSEHPYVNPTEVDPTQKLDWMRRESEREREVVPNFEPFEFMQ